MTKSQYSILNCSTFTKKKNKNTRERNESSRLVFGCINSVNDENMNNYKICLLRYVQVVDEESIQEIRTRLQLNSCALRSITKKKKQSKGVSVIFISKSVFTRFH